MKNVLIIFLILIIAGGIWFYFNKSNQEENGTKTPQPSPLSQERKFPGGFSSKGFKEKELDLDGDGKKELLLTSLNASGPQAVLTDSADFSKAFSNIFNFSTAGFSEEFSFKAEEAPEVYQVTDLNANGKKELIFDLENYGAYTSTYGVVIFLNKKFEWLMVEEENGSSHPAIFQDGASVRNAEVFKVLEDKKALVQVSGVGDNDGSWTWDVKAFSWNGEKYVFNAALSAEILKEQPKRFEDAKPVF